MLTRRPGTAWQLTFADMLSQLLCLLVLAYSLKIQADDGRSTALAAIRGLFGGQAVAAAPPASQAGASTTANYLTTWLQTRLADAPALAGMAIQPTGQASRLLPDPGLIRDREALRQLAEILDRSGRQVAIVAMSSSNDPQAWSQAARSAAMLALALRDNGLAAIPRLVVQSDGDGLFIDVEEDGA